MIVQVPLEKIPPTPWQTRHQEPDPGYIAELKESIRASGGLLQIPVGRVVVGAIPTDHTKYGWPGDPTSFLENNQYAAIQLAFGHNRLAAYKLLAAEDPARWSSMPVDVRVLTNEQMADHAWEENERRRDHNALDRAYAIQKRMADFGWNQSQIAKRMHLDPAVVSNSLRLPRLPEEIQKHIQAGKLSERQAIALLTLYELPGSLRDRAEQNWDDATKPSRIVRDALDGASSDHIRDRIRKLLQNHGKHLKHAEWSLDREFAGEEIHSPACSACDARATVGGDRYCLVLRCFYAKMETAKQEYLQRASAASGIPVSESGFKGGSLIYDREYVPRIREAGCENLRLIYDESNDNARYRSATLHDLGFPNATIACKKPKQFCTCLSGLKAMEEAKKRQPAAAPVSTPAPGVDADPGSPEPAEPERAQASVQAEPSAADLEAAAKAARAEKRAGQELVKRIAGQTASLIARALADADQGAWYLLLKRVTWNQAGDTKHVTVEGLRQIIAEKIVEHDLLPYTKDNPEYVLEQVNTELKKVGLPQIELSDDGWVRVADDQVAGILRRLERIQGWIDRLKDGQIPMREAVQGNLDNLDRLHLDVVRYIAGALSSSDRTGEPEDPRLSGVGQRILDARARLQAEMETPDNPFPVF